MKDVSIRRCGWAVTLTLVPLLPLSIALAQQSSTPTQQVSVVPAAQSVDSIVSLTPSQAASFESAFTFLAQQGHVAFVAEDQPLRLTLLPRQMPRLQASGEPLSQMVAEVAAAYDYDAERHGNVFVLKKRYTDPADLPDVTLAECARSLKELQELTDAISPHLNFGQLGKNEAVANLLTSLTPEQLEMMQDKSLSVPKIDPMKATDAQISADSQQRYDLANQSPGLPISTLTPEQRDVIRQMLLVIKIELPADFLNVRQVAEAAANDPSFCRRAADGGQSFGYEVPGEAPKQENYQGLIFWGGSARITMNGVALLPPVDQTAQFLRVQPAPPVVSVSLTQAISSLDARTIDQPKMQVDTALAPKHVSLFGTHNASPAALLQSCADVYGLSVHTQEDKSLLLTSQDIQIPLDYAAMIANIHKAILDPLRRAMAQEAVRGKAIEPSRHEIKGRAVLTVGPATMRSSALRMLRAAAESRIKTAKDGHVLLSSLGASENTALAVALTLPQLEYIIGLGEGEVPVTLTRFDDLFLRGGPSPTDSRKFGIEFYLPVTDGTAAFQQVGAIGNIDYTPNSAVVDSVAP